MLYSGDCGFIGSKYLDDTDLPFEDVPNDAWYSPYVDISYKLGILCGKSETVFDPNAEMTCAEAVKIAACIHEYQTTQLINPDSQVKRSEAAAFISRILNANMRIGMPKG